MTSMTDPERGGFRLSMLLNDTRYRSYTFQFIALILLISAIAFLGRNLMSNLAAAGLNIDYGFLGDTANYDINQRLIEYTSQSTHARAAFVGIFNTLLVAFLACVTATFLGVIAGVLRLSKNWLVSKIMSVYVEIFRNIPVLIWLIIIFTIMTAVLPQPRDFRGDEPKASMIADSFAFTNRGVYTPKPVFNNSLGGNEMAENADGVSSIVATSTGMDWIAVLVVLFGSWFAVNRLKARANRIQEETGDRPNTLIPGLLVWVLPIVALLWFLGLTMDYPALKGFNFQGGIQIGGPLIALWFALSIYTGAFIAENVRAGIQAISKGQTEAAASLGLRPNRVMNLVVLPQALRVIIPPLISQYLNITKNSSLAIAVGYADVTATLGGITLNQTGRAIECILLLMLFYLTISLLISMVMNVYNRSVTLKER